MSQLNVNQSLLDRRQQLEQKLSADMMSAELRPIHNIYFDLSVLQDLNIGTLLLHTKTEEEYNNILACIPIYLAKIEPSVCKYFPTTTLTDDYIKKFIKDPKNAEMLYTASPHTTVWYMLPHVFQQVYKKNKIIDNNQFKCNMILNISISGYTETVCKIIATKMRLINRNITLQTVSKPIHELSKQTRVTPDVYFVEDIGQWISTDSIVSKEFYEDLLYENKHFFSRRVITATDVVVPVTEAFMKSREFMRTFTDFNFMDVGIPNIQYVPPVVEEDPSKDLDI